MTMMGLLWWISRRSIMQASDFQLMPLFVFLLISLFDRNTVKISFPVKIFLLHNAEKMEPVIQNSQNTHKR